MQDKGSEIGADRQQQCAKPVERNMSEDEYFAKISKVPIFIGGERISEAKKPVPSATSDAASNQPKV